MRAIITCECCRHRQWLVRPIDRPESFHVICHRCERVLQVSVTGEQLAAAAEAPPGAGLPGREGPWPPDPGGPLPPEPGGPWPQPPAGIDGGGWITPLV